MTERPIPRLVTRRLILRAPTEADFPVYAGFLNSARARGMGGPYGLRAAWGLFCHEVAGWTLHGHGALMIDLRVSGGVRRAGRHQSRAALPREGTRLAHLCRA